MPSSYGFYEFFAGGGMARLGLGSRWQCLLANEICAKKAAGYRLNFGPSPELKVQDVRSLTLRDLTPQATLAWASFPCQDLSLAGNGRGLHGERSGAFLPFWQLMAAIAKDRRPVPLIVVENVTGLVTSRDGRDFQCLLETMAATGYRVGPLIIDAVHFLPQSRPRLFLLAIHRSTPLPEALLAAEPADLWHTPRLRESYHRLPANLRRAWIWWKLPAPRQPRQTLDALIEEQPDSISWHSRAETTRLLSLMSATNLEKVREAQRRNQRVVGTVYKRTRPDADGSSRQRAEVRFDQISGCLRTPAGGSSRQVILIVEGRSIRSRLLSPREAARLMGVPESYRLPPRYNDAYHLMGDGLAVPVVAWLEAHLLRPLAEGIE